MLLFTIEFYKIIDDSPSFHIFRVFLIKFLVYYYYFSI